MTQARRPHRATLLVAGFAVVLAGSGVALAARDGDVSAILIANACVPVAVLTFGLHRRYVTKHEPGTPMVPLHPVVVAFVAVATLVVAWSVALTIRDGAVTGLALAVWSGILAMLVVLSYERFGRT